MKIEITETKKFKIEIEIEFPYYYKHDLTDYDYENISVIYGKITEKEEVTIHEKIRDNGNVIYELEKDGRSDCYFTEQYKSNKEEYEKARERSKQFFTVL
jgi:hypothetical protein